jgi:hypothetical protein
MVYFLKKLSISKPISKPRWQNVWPLCWVQCAIETAGGHRPLSADPSKQDARAGAPIWVPQLEMALIVVLSLLCSKEAARNGRHIWICETQDRQAGRRAKQQQPRSLRMSMLYLTRPASFNGDATMLLPTRCVAGTRMWCASLFVIFFTASSRLARASSHMMWAELRDSGTASCHIARLPMCAVPIW